MKTHNEHGERIHWPPRPRYRLHVRIVSRGARFRGGHPYWVPVREWRVRDADGWVTAWMPSAREACAKMRYGLVL